MQKIVRIILFLGTVFLITDCTSSGPKGPKRNSEQEVIPNTGYYTADWESLARYNEEPEWIKNAKFGIYFTWGVYSVPAFEGEWYPREMHRIGTNRHQHHLEKYGDPATFGYHDFIPMFTAEHFNADEWAALFKKAGARFAGPVAEHHDGFSMWASKANPWNAGDKGPKRDIVGEMERAIRNQDMKFITTFHHAFNHQSPVTETEDEYPTGYYPNVKGWPTDSEDQELSILYGNIPREAFLKLWSAKLYEVIDGYHPDIIWFDFALHSIDEKIRQEFCTYYLNKTLEWDKEVVIVRKQEDLPDEVSIKDLEKSRMNRIGSQTWMTDNTVTTDSWCYTEDMVLKESRDIVHELIDIVSKNGILLLNVSPKADGTIPQEQQDILLDIGEWLDKNGEAIYGTRPWLVYGEDPVKEPEGHFDNAGEFLKIKYSEKDIRYTTKEDAIFAIVLGKPTGNILMKSFAKDSLQKYLEIRNVTILSTDYETDWELTDEGLSVRPPFGELDDMATVFRLEINGLVVN